MKHKSCIKIKRNLKEYFHINSEIKRAASNKYCNSRTCRHLKNKYKVKKKISTSVNFEINIF